MSQMAARAMQQLRYHTAWVVLGHKHRNRNESGTITIKANRQKKDRAGQTYPLL